jgi:hypothetical protein
VTEALTESLQENLKPNLKPILAAAPDRKLEVAPALTVRAAAEPRDRPQRRALDVSAIITRALTAAGLIRNRDAT